MLKPKKKWGQNFLTDPNVSKKILKVLDNKPTDRILEIGPGQGALTSLINAKKIIAIEIDKNLCEVLSEKNINNLEIINDNFLKTDLDNINFDKIIGNLPYNISSQIIFKILNNNNWNKAVFMVQKELADRIISKEGSKKYGRISVMIQAMSDVKKEFNVSRNCFFPKPDVTSTIISLTNTKRLNFDYNKLELIVKKCFSQRRKKVKNVFPEISSYHQLNKYFDKRAEDLSIQDYIKISDIIKGLF